MRPNHLLVKYVLLGFIILTLPSLSLAQSEERFAAFGIPLGSNVADLTVVGRADFPFLPVGNPKGLLVAPPVPNEAFSEYHVLHTPKTNLVYSIGAKTDIQGYEACENMRDGVLGKLVSKYDNLQEVYYDGATHRIGNVNVFLKCVGANGSFWLSLVYKLPTLEDQAEREKLDQASEQINADGL